MSEYIMAIFLGKSEIKKGVYANLESGGNLAIASGGCIGRTHRADASKVGACEAQRLR